MPFIRATAWHHRLALLLVCAAGAGGVQAATYYVAPAGSDAANGTSIEIPLKTIQKAVERAGPGDEIQVRAGTYREDIDIKAGGAAGRLLTIAAYKGETPVIKGSDIVTGWTQQDANTWKKTDWKINSQQVFVDFDTRPGPPLQQIGMPSRFYKTFEYPKAVGQGLADMTPGSFFYDPAAGTLYIRLADGSDPNRHTVEVSTRKNLLRLDAPYVRVQGLAFRHSNVSANMQQGAAITMSSNSVLDHCDVQWADFAGVNLGLNTTGVQVTNSNISNNGDSAINAPGSYAFRIAGNQLTGNNYRNFNPLWHAGGVKATTKAYGTVERNEVAHNNGSGIWFDYANSKQPLIVRNNFIHDNGPVDSGIFIEVSNNGRVYNNVLANNARRGIYLSGSDGIHVYNNTIFGTKGYAGIELGGMPRQGATLTDNRVYNNIISHGESRYDLIIAPDNGSTIAGNQSDYNNVYRPNAPIHLASAGNFTDLRAWQGATHMDERSISADPDFVAPGAARASADLEVKPGSPVTRAGKAPDDTVEGATAAPAAGVFPIGASGIAPRK
ncbi:MAG TPA: right-handed parallel beta-helix repeat-containing protein [Burkholderiales bacterium]|nr:right-handed parallel beta-helix repeat-containing protein [Burkholderiales bacterium]